MIAHKHVSLLKNLRPRITMTLSEFVRAEWKPNAALALKKSSMHIYSYQIEKHILPTPGELPLRDLGIAQIEACLSNLMQKGHATSTMRSVRATFATVLRLRSNAVMSRRTLLTESSFAKSIPRKSGGSVRQTRRACGSVC